MNANNVGKLEKISGALDILLKRVEHIESEVKDMKDASTSVGTNRTPPKVKVPLIIRVSNV